MRGRIEKPNQLALMLPTVLLLFARLPRCLSLATTASPTTLSPLPSDLEIFSVAPMMAHTNRHHNRYFRHFSERAHLYTEMIPAETVASLYRRGNALDRNEELRELLGIFPSRDPNDGPIILQLGGRNPETLALASEIGVAMGYDGINLNCGCPSDAVSGRAGGCALMRDPGHVAEIVERMSEGISRAEEQHSRVGKVKLSVKHRLGVRDASTYDASADRAKNDEEAFRECDQFVRAITHNSRVGSLQVHARVGLIGGFVPDRDESTALWTPSSSFSSPSSGCDTPKKIDHKREQHKAKKRARQATLDNRSVPPLRLEVVNHLAENYPKLEFVTNGGIKSMDDIYRRTSGTNVVGAMVGRAAINHPCSFSHVDELWGQDSSLPSWTREDVLSSHIDYCIKEEAQIEGRRPASYLHELRKRLVAVPFSLFAGEEGNDAYQRAIRKLANRLGSGRHSAAAILQGALIHVPAEVRAKPVTEFASMDGIRTYTEFNQRSGPMQRAIL